MRRQDWTLMTVAAAGGESLSPVQLQKALFLLGQALPDQVGPSYYSFIPHNYGPFDRLIYHDAERLSEEGLIAIARPVGQRWSEYAATPQGLERAAVLREEAPARAIRYLADVVGWVRGLSFEDLIRAIYQDYPEYKVNSVFRGA